MVKPIGFLPPAPLTSARAPSDDPRLQTMLELAAKNTDAQLAMMPDGTAYVKTGDIPAQWLRDSSAQVRPWLLDAKADVKIRTKLKAVIQRQAKMMARDPYANAFRADYSVWERKFELDSLAYPILLVWTYWKVTGDSSVFTPQVLQGFKAALRTMQTEQHHASASTYTFKSDSEDPFKNPVGPTGMIWSGFRPSDDVCTYNYLIPSEMQAVQALGALSEIAGSVYHNGQLAKEAATMRAQVHAGIQTYGIVDDPIFGKRYAYEVDGLGHSLSMDDANLPSLLSAPYFGYVREDDEVYQNTRRWVLSKANPYFFAGALASGVGSPHVPKPWVWPLGLLAQGLTTHDPAERAQVTRQLLNSDPGDHRLHESFDPNDPRKLTRPDFGWPNALFVEYFRTVTGSAKALPTPPPP